MRWQSLAGRQAEDLLEALTTEFHSLFVGHESVALGNHGKGVVAIHSHDRAEVGNLLVLHLGRKCHTGPFGHRVFSSQEDRL